MALSSCKVIIEKLIRSLGLAPICFARFHDHSTWLVFLLTFNQKTRSLSQHEKLWVDCNNKNGYITFGTEHKHVGVHDSLLVVFLLLLLFAKPAVQEHRVVLGANRELASRSWRWRFVETRRRELHLLPLIRLQVEQIRVVVESTIPFFMFLLLLLSNKILTKILF